MDCNTFQRNLNDFIYDKIEYSEDLEEFLEHAKNCESCNEDLELYYTIHRGLGDVEPPVDNSEIMDVKKELSTIIGFYDEVFEKQRFMRKAGRISVCVFGVALIGIVVYVYLRLSGYL